MSKYNRAGHVCPNTGRVAMTVTEVLELQNEIGDVHSFTYDKEAEGFGTDPWRLIDGINPMVNEAKACTYDQMTWVVQCSSPGCGLKVQRGVVNERTMPVCKITAMTVWNRRVK